MNRASLSWDKGTKDWSSRRACFFQRLASIRSLEFTARRGAKKNWDYAVLCWYSVSRVSLSREQRFYVRDDLVAIRFVVHAPVIRVFDALHYRHIRETLIDATISLYVKFRLLKWHDEVPGEILRFPERHVLHHGEILKQYIFVITMLGSEGERERGFMHIVRPWEELHRKISVLDFLTLFNVSKCNFFFRFLVSGSSIIEHTGEGKD